MPPPILARISILLRDNDRWGQGKRGHRKTILDCGAKWKYYSNCGILSAYNDALPMQIFLGVVDDYC